MRKRLIDRNPAMDLRGLIEPRKQEHHPSLTEPSDIARLRDKIKGYSGGKTLRNAMKPQQTRLLREMSFIGRSFRYPSVEEFAFKNHMSTRQFYRVKSGVIRMIAWEVYRRGVMR